MLPALKTVPDFQRITGLLLAAMLLFGCGEAKREPAQTEVQPAPKLLEYQNPPVANPAAGAGFAGVESCKSCHEQAYADWKQSQHSVAMQHATEQTVLADFKDAEFTHFGHTTRFFRKDGGFWVNTEDSEGKRQDYPVLYTFGVFPLQQYLIPFPGGRMQALNICWDLRPREQGGQRWFHLYPDEEIPPSDILHWTRRHFNWNYMCADCHSTNLVKSYDPDANAYKTTWSDISVACETCHGPASKHVAWAEERKKLTQTAPGAASLPKPATEAEMGLTVALKEPQMAVWLQDPETWKPKRSHPLENDAQLETCAPCHAHRQVLQPQRFYGQKFTDGYVPTVLSRVHYHADGQIKEEVYEYASFTQSKMYQKGVRCSDCHHPHTMKAYMLDNNLCNRCHLPTKYDTPEHHFHKVGSTGASCVECHMPPKYYMVVDKRRDHSIRIPRPDLSRQYGTPNACTVCHTKKEEDDAWAAAAFEKWWGKKERPSHGEVLAKGRRDASIWQSELVGLVQNETMPAIARASAIQLLGERLAAGALPAIRTALLDPSPVVRRQALTALEGLPVSDRLASALPRLRDVDRSVRVEAARLLASADRRTLSTEDGKALDFATGELVASQQAVADVPEGHLSLAILHLDQGDRGRAEQEYLHALRLEPENVPARVNLADLYYQSNRFDEAGKLLEEAVHFRPDDGFAQEALGRHFIRAKKYEPGLEHIRAAVKLQPERAELNYLLGVGCNSLGKYQDALPWLEKAIRLDPGNREYVLGAAAICRDAGDFRTGLRFVESGLERHPGDPEMSQLGQEFRSRSGG